MNSAPFLLALDFAARKHRFQKRKDADASPYINHPIAVAMILAVEGQVTDQDLLLAALLHDTVEDTETTFEELMTRFGEAVTDLVREVTDDKSLLKDERKQRQILHAAESSPRARLLKIADKTANIRDITDSPPATWSVARRLEYLTWSEQVVTGCRGVNAGLDVAFAAAVAGARERLAETPKIVGEIAFRTMGDGGRAFQCYVGIDYSGAETPGASLSGLRVFTATRQDPSLEEPPPRGPTSSVGAR